VSSTPRRIFTVTGIETAAATASVMRAAWSPSPSIRCPPAPVFVTFLTGHPMFMSSRSAPAASTIRAASAIRSGSEPEDLDRQRPLVARDAQVAQRALVRVVQPARRDHLGAHQACTEAAALPAEGLDGDAGHRRQDDPARDLDRPDRPRVGQGAGDDGHRTRVPGALPSPGAARGDRR
jgi:hypothetical protein